MANERQHADYQRYLKFKKDDLFQVPSDKKYVPILHVLLMWELM